MAGLSNDRCSSSGDATRPTRNRLRDGRMRLPVGARLATTGCQVSGTMHRQRETHTGCELAEILMANNGEPTINLVKSARRNAVTRLAKRQAGRRWYWCLTISPFVAPPGKDGCLKESQKVGHAEHGKPVHPHGEYVVCQPQGGRKGEQAEEPRKSECRLATSRIGSHDLIGNDADFKGGRNRESGVKETRVT
jgi:hypothetical protein